MMKSGGPRTQFAVREVRSETELAGCTALDHSYTTDYVWQVDMREDQDSTTVRFRVIHLPRAMAVDYPHGTEALLRSWKERDCFLVAVSGDVLLGYVNMRIQPDGVRGWIHDLVVGKPFRRRRIGSALLEQACYWAEIHGITRVTIELQTKNYPGIQFVVAQGFTFSGYNDAHYLNRDIAVFFSRNLR